MSEQYKFLNPEGLYFTTSTIINWIDLFTALALVCRQALGGGERVRAHFPILNLIFIF